MPGRNCCMPQCTVSQTSKHLGMKLYQITTRKDEFYSNWKKDILTVVSRYRVIDKIFKARIENGRAFICENHYAEADFEVTSEYKTFPLCFVITDLSCNKYVSYNFTEWKIFLKYQPN